MGFAEGFMQGFGLMDAYYTRKDEREYRKERREMERESHDANMARIKQQGELTDLQIGEYKDQNFANEYASIVTNDDGSPIDLSKLTPEQLHQKKGQFTGFLNRFEPAKRFFTENKDVDPENPLAGVDIIYDKKSKQPSMVFNLRMKDGRTATLSERRSSDKDDPYVIVPLTEVDAQIRGALGSKMGMKATPQEYRANKAASDAADTKYRREIGLESVKHKNAMQLQALKEGYSLDADGNPVAAGGGRLRGKALDEERKIVRATTGKVLGSESMSGIVLDGTGNQYTVANLIGDDLLTSGRVRSGDQAAKIGLQMAEDIYANGGQVVWDNDSGTFLLIDGTTDEQGRPNARPLLGEPAPAAGSSRSGSVKREPPTYEKYAADLRAANPGMDIQDSEIRARYNNRFGGAVPENTENQAPDGAGLEHAEKQAAPIEKSASTEKPKATQKGPGKDPKAPSEQRSSGMGAKLTLADVDAMRGNEGRTPQQNLSRVKSMLDTGRDEFGRELTKESRQRLIDEYNRLYSQIAEPNVGISFRHQ